MSRLIIFGLFFISLSCYASEVITKNLKVKNQSIINIEAINKFDKNTSEPMCFVNIMYKSISLNDYVGDHCGNILAEKINDELIKVTTVNNQGNLFIYSFYFYDQNIIKKIGDVVDNGEEIIDM